MEGLSYLCLGAVLCPIAIAISAVFFVPAFFGGRALISSKFGKSRAWIVAPFAVVIALLVAFFAFYRMFAPAFPGWYTPQQRPQDKDIVGTWTATPATLELIAEQGYGPASPTFQFNSDGKFVATDIPDIIFFHRNLILYAGEGTWTAARDFQGEWQVELTFTRIDPPWFPDPPLSGPTPCPGQTVPCEGLPYPLWMWNRRPPYVIYANIGGELGPNVDFKRQGEEYGDSP